ncbi:hypothetical protein [Nocardia sp. NPDC005366]|uniref:hypothetical protein n=1 Tax=Nocardia sp. NPDC005366 TaxID=3156878 RepID=UPI0033BF588F
MNRDESTEIGTAELASHVRSLIERTVLGAEGPRRLRVRASRDQLERIRRLRLSDVATSMGPSELSARRLIAEALEEARLPQRTPDPDRITVATSVTTEVSYPVLVACGPFRDDQATLARVVDGLHGSPS